MEAKVRIDASYYEFLEIIQDVSKNSVSIQKNLIRRIYQNYDVNKVKNNLNKKIAQLDKLLIK
jgi:hypothetical protein